MARPSDNSTDVSIFLAQRRHFVAQLIHCFPPILLYQHLLCPSILAIVFRTFVHIRIATPRLHQPLASLLALSAGVIVVNAVVLLMHYLDLLDGIDHIGKGLIIDFVGLKNPTKKSTIFLLDALITIFQLITLYIGYLSDPIKLNPESEIESESGAEQKWPPDPLLPSPSIDSFRQRRGQSHRSPSVRGRKPNEGRRRKQGDDEAEQGLHSHGNHDRPFDSDEDHVLGRRENVEEFDDGREREPLLEEEIENTRRAGMDDQEETEGNLPPLIVDIPFLRFLKTIFTYPTPIEAALASSRRQPGALPTRSDIDAFMAASLREMQEPRDAQARTAPVRGERPLAESEALRTLPGGYERLSRPTEDQNTSQRNMEAG